LNKKVKPPNREALLLFGYVFLSVLDINAFVGTRDALAIQIIDGTISFSFIDVNSTDYSLL
jgi:hypothetical protein